MSGKKFLNETFTTQESYINLSQDGPKIIKQLIGPLRANVGIDKDYNGQQKIQYYIKFSNQIILKVFLSYLCGKKFAFEKEIANEEGSIQAIIEKLNHLKQHYKSNKKELEAIDQGSLDEVIRGINNTYLYLSNLNIQNVKEQQFEDQDQSTIALAVLRYNKNIILAVLKRTPVKKEQQPKQINQKGKDNPKLLLNIEQLSFPVLCILIIFLVIWYNNQIYQIGQSVLNYKSVMKLEHYF